VHNEYTQLTSTFCSILQKCKFTASLNDTPFPLLLVEFSHSRTQIFNIVYAKAQQQTQFSGSSIHLYSIFTPYLLLFPPSVCILELPQQYSVGSHSLSHFIYMPANRGFLGSTTASYLKFFTLLRTNYFSVNLVVKHL